MHSVYSPSLNAFEIVCSFLTFADSLLLTCFLQGLLLNASSSDPQLNCNFPYLLLRFAQVLLSLLLQTDRLQLANDFFTNQNYSVVVSQHSKQPTCNNVRVRGIVSVVTSNFSFSKYRPCLDLGSLFLWRKYTHRKPWDMPSSTESCQRYLKPRSNNEPRLPLSHLPIRELAETVWFRQLRPLRYHLWTMRMRAQGPQKRYNAMWSCLQAARCYCLGELRS